MWLKLDLDGINFQLEIANYTQRDFRGDYPDDWCMVSMKCQSGGWLNYIVDRQELLLSEEVDELQSALLRFLMMNLLELE